MWLDSPVTHSPLKVSQLSFQAACSAGYLFFLGEPEPGPAHGKGLGRLQERVTSTAVKVKAQHPGL